MPRDTFGILVDIRDAAGYIVEDTAGASFDEFDRDRRMRQLVEHNFVIIGEAVNRLRRNAPALTARITAYDQIIGLRNVLVHGYDIVEAETVWDAVHTSLPVLRAEVDLLLREAAVGEDAGEAETPCIP